MEGLAGNAGWFGAGLLGLVLCWVFMIHLPALSKALKELLATSAKERQGMMDRYDAERETEREARHGRADKFQEMMNHITVVHQQALKDLEDQHRRDAKDDRDAFMARSIRVEDAIKVQTTELKLALLEGMRGICQAAQHAVAHPRLPDKG